jgi:glycosyltransferase involved in cell wall biosynthesis
MSTELRRPGRIPLAVIVRTLGREQLGDALDSLAAQTVADFETVIIDMSGGRADEFITPRRAALPYILHCAFPGRVGRSEALNLGVLSSSAEAFAILDDDNLFTPTHLEILMNGLAETGADLLYTGVLRQTLTPDGRLVDERALQTPFDRARLLFGNFIYATGTVFRRRIWQRVGGYDVRFPVYEDWEFLIRVAHEGRIEAIPVVSGISRGFTGDPTRASHNAETEDCARCAAALFWKHRHRYTQAFFEANPSLAASHPWVPLGGTRPDLEPLVAEWGRLAPRAAVRES